MYLLTSFILAVAGGIIMFLAANQQGFAMLLAVLFAFACGGLGSRLEFMTGMRKRIAEISEKGFIL